MVLSDTETLPVSPVAYVILKHHLNSKNALSLIVSFRIAPVVLVLDLKKYMNIILGGGESLGTKQGVFRFGYLFTDYKIQTEILLIAPATEYSNLLTFSRPSQNEFTR